MSCFQVAMLASGSKGNAAVIAAKGQYFLIDMGLSCRELTARLKKVHIEPQQLSGVFITHEHADHVKGLATFSKKYTVPIYTSEKTWRAILARDMGIKRTACHIIDTNISYNSIKITSFGIPHDAADPHGYIFENLESGTKCTYLTDTGFVTEAVREAVKGAELLVLEANHDVEMLRRGGYPEYLKQRILSSRGHLSNDTAAQLLANLKELPKEIFLAHLSEENNRPELALKAVRQAVLSVPKEKQPAFYVAMQHEVVTNFSANQIELF